jgi:hypothetical protein
MSAVMEDLVSFGTDLDSFGLDAHEHALLADSFQVSPSLKVTLPVELEKTVRSCCCTQVDVNLQRL